MQVKFHIYDKRYEVYEKVKQFIASVCQAGKVDDDKYRQFWQDTRQAYFLFGQDIDSYIEKIYHNSFDLKRYDEALERPRLRDIERDAIIDKRFELTEWFGDQFYESRKLFGEFLSLEKIR